MHRKMPQEAVERAAAVADREERGLERRDPVDQPRGVRLVEARSFDGQVRYRERHYHRKYGDELL